jgi:2,4'-dihydroxyacetophenone dioxygenase
MTADTPAGQPTGPTCRDCWTTSAAGPGSFVHESPGVIHTLSAGPGMKTFFAINGTLEYFDDQDQLTQIQDVFWAINCYLSHCSRHGLPINEALFM